MTSRDVASAAGVSQTTVSFVLNGRDDQGISAETRDHVLAKARALGYVPSAAARSLRTGTSGVVLVLLPDMPVTHAMEEFKVELSTALARSDLSCVYFHQSDERQRSDTELWQQVNPAVVVAFGHLDSVSTAALDRAGVPLIDDVFGSKSVDHIGLDQSAISTLQVRHLVAKGHQRIAYASPSDSREARFSEPRLEGARRACAEAGVDLVAVRSSEVRREDAREAVDEMMRTHTTAVAAYNDLIALSIIDSCRERSLAVPTDLAVIGVDDLAVSSLVQPRLTTVAFGLGAYAAHLASTIVTRLPFVRSVDTHDTGRPAELLSVIERQST
ncbi:MULTISPECIES: LacI family DNA-binding transcriptional regulator [Nocardiaceae]|uniref:DNA-binding LacI/PurR family transcriptional regulator n=1 Tax=Rhodococcoides corynebacterioides TaxID=53972 RepID=A0ABS2KU76_9NOCA|nr:MULTISPECIES: LacI family DNA-binding transcriptional regulator [Rhodococcus]MBM7415499.1 DNA-binding LacI/PurR family transcriptional regulator [Rhodococcus corynebacterioides]MBP1117961.1 DNA-binding LacI/PurR family transcriptional regulator [Rhodococcus sp. PvP016]